jgi:hypothetical protein
MGQTKQPFSPCNPFFSSWTAMTSPQRKVTLIHFFREPVGGKQLLKTDDMGPLLRSNLGKSNRFIDILFLFLTTGYLNSRQFHPLFTFRLIEK